MKRRPAAHRVNRGRPHLEVGALEANLINRMDCALLVGWSIDTVPYYYGCTYSPLLLLYDSFQFRLFNPLRRMGEDKQMHPYLSMNSVWV